MAAELPKENSKVSVVLSFRNEADVLDELADRLVAVFEDDGCPYELIFVNDDSTDTSLEILTRRAKENQNIKVVNMSRNFGVTECVFAGMAHASGDAVVYLDTDLQDPPEVIPELIAKWRAGAEVVITKRLSRDGESAYRLFFTRLAYKIINSISEIELPVEAGDFRLLSRRAVDRLLAMPESYPYLRGLSLWVGYERDEVHYHRAPRGGGASHFPGVFTPQPVKVFIDGITSFSMFPLYLVLYAGLAGVGLGAGGLVLTALAAVIWGWCAAAGWIFFLLLLWGGLMCGMGILGLYLARIYRDVRGRPRYIVRDTVNL